MRKLLLILNLFSIYPFMLPAQPNPAPTVPTWRDRLDEAMPLARPSQLDPHRPFRLSPPKIFVRSLYHRDHSDQAEVVREVLHAINRSVHVRPVITMDSELHFVSEVDALGRLPPTAIRN